jgi:hypothetical protein
MMPAFLCGPLTIATFPEPGTYIKAGESCIEFHMLHVTQGVCLS